VLVQPLTTEIAVKAMGRCERRLVVLATVAASAAGAGAQAVSREQTPVRSEVERQEKTYDAIIELIDLEQGRIVASQRFPAPLMMFEKDLVSTVRVLADGQVAVEISRVTLVRP
jgi:hypothetical protein